MMHDDMYDAKYRQTDTLYEPVLFEPLKQIRVSQAMFTAISLIDFGPYLESFDSLKRYIEWLENQMMDIATNHIHRFMEQNLSMVIHRTPLISAGISDHTKYIINFILCLYKGIKKILFLKETFQNMHSRFSDTLYHLWNHPESMDDTETATLKTPTSHDHSKNAFFLD